MVRPEKSLDPAATPNRPLLWAALVSALATLTVAWPALLGKFLVNPHSDQYIAGFAFREFAAMSLKDGNGFPLWNPYLFGGMPYVAAMHGDIFYPTFLLRMVLPTDVAMTWGFVLHMMLAGLFTFGFLRSIGVRFHAGLIGAIAYLLAGPVASYASPGHDGKLFVSTLLPAALWLLVRGIRGGKTSAWGLLAIVVGLAVLSPHPQLLQYMLLVMGAFALWLVWARDTDVPAMASQMRAGTTRETAGSASAAAVSADVSAERKGRLPRLFIAAAALILGGAMGAIQYLPLSEYTPWSPRSGGKGWDHATSYSFPLEETINTYLPQFSGILDAYWGVNGIHFHSEYLGAAVLVLMLAGIGGGLANPHRRHGWFWLGVFVISLLWAWGGNTPFFHIIYNLVPGTKYFRAPSTMLYVVGFSAAVLAAFGAERALASRISMRYVVGWLIVAGVIAVMATAGLFTNLALNLRPEASEWIAQNESAVVIGAWRSALFVAAACAIMILVLRKRLVPSVAGFALLAVVTLDLWSVARHYWMFSEPASELFAEDAITQYIKAQPQPGRVLPLRLGSSNPRDPFIRGDAFMHLGVRNTLGYHGNELGRYQQLYGHAEGGKNIANPNFWALTNTQYLYTDIPEPPLEGARLVAGPARNSAGTMAYLYRLPGEQPAAWVAPIIVKLDDATASATLLDPRFDVRRAAIFDTAAQVSAQPVESTVPEPLGLEATVTRWDAGAIDIQLAAPAPAGSALLVSENFYPGWTATVDGAAAPIGRADLVLIGVELPAGAKAIELRFDSEPYRQGRVITLLAVILAVLLAGWGWVAERRRPAPALRDS